MFDSHCHLTAARFDDDRAAVLERMRAAGIRGCVTIASDLADAEAAARLAEDVDDVWCTAGVHPHQAEDAAGDWPAELRQRLARPRCVAVGESGLDYYYENSPRAIQRSVFEEQLQIAGEVGLPIVVHSRDAEADTIAMIEAARDVTGVLHCFDGSRRLLDVVLDAGWYVSFSGLITFRRYAGAELVAAVPEDRLLLETDSPYLAPVPHRGRRNEPAHLVETVRIAAGMRGMDAAELGALTHANAVRFYGLEHTGS